MHVAEVMLEDMSGESGNCLHGDGSSKCHRRFETLQITTTCSRHLSFELSEIVSGDTHTIFELFFRSNS